MSSVVNRALFINGVFRSVLDRILDTQSGNPDHPLFLRPSSSSSIAMLRANPPTTDCPVILYVSTSDDLNQVSYVGEVIRWEDATGLSPERIEHINEVLLLHQEGESPVDGQSSSGVNLLSVRRLSRFPEPFSAGKLVKVSDGLPLSANRTRAGGWSAVHPCPVGVGR